MARIATAAFLIVLTLAPAVGAKGIAGVAVEVCDDNACVPIVERIDVEHLTRSVWRSAIDGGRRLEPADVAPAYEIRVWPADEHGADLFDAAPGKPVEIDYLPYMKAVRARSHHSKRHWARLGNPGVRVLHRAVASLTAMPPAGSSAKSGRAEEGEAEETRLLVGGGIALAVAAGCGVTRRRRRVRP